MRETTAAPSFTVIKMAAPPTEAGAGGNPTPASPHGRVRRNGRRAPDPARSGPRTPRLAGGDVMARTYGYPLPPPVGQGGGRAPFPPPRGQSPCRAQRGVGRALRTRRPFPCARFIGRSDGQSGEDTHRAIHAHFASGSRGGRGCGSEGAESQWPAGKPRREGKDAADVEGLGGARALSDRLGYEAG